jgi:peptidoglycan/LPS O-acetylase OafA/YrhL
MGMFLVFLSSRKATAGRIMMWLGDISYSIYIVSPVIMMLSDTYISSKAGQILGSIFISLILSTLTFNHIEKPIIT